MTRYQLNSILCLVCTRILEKTFKLVKGLCLSGVETMGAYLYLGTCPNVVNTVTTPSDHCALKLALALSLN